MRNGLGIHRINLFAIIAIIILIGAVLFVWGTTLNQGWTQSLLTRLGLALITAGIVAMFTAWYLKERLIQEIQGRVSDVLGEFRTEAIDAFQLQKLPHEILESVRTTLLNKPIIQRNLTTDYQMQVVHIDNKPALRAVITSSSNYENLTGEWQNSKIYEVGSALDDALQGSSQTADSGF